jgi:DNA-binding HxlR family transcriptional regulator
MQDLSRYRHFCPMAQAIERLGERWGLLILRDLLPGPQRFTDLLRTCGGITPRQLSARLRQLEADGIIDPDRKPGRREVWYRLTPAGEELRPAIEALLLWGVRHLARPPRPDEPILPYTLIDGTRLAIAAAGVRPPEAVRWTWRFPGEPFTLRFDGQDWSLERGEQSDADVVVDTTPRDWAIFVASGASATAASAMRVTGRQERVDEFLRVFPGARRTARAGRRSL